MFVEKSISGDFPTEAPVRRVIGYRIESMDEKHIIPSCFFSFEVLTEAVANAWLNVHKNRPGTKWKKVEVFEGDIEDPVFIK